MYYEVERKIYWTNVSNYAQVELFQWIIMANTKADICDGGDDDGVCVCVLGVFRAENAQNFDWWKHDGEVK